MSIKDVKEKFLEDGKLVLDMEMAQATGRKSLLDPNRVDITKHPKIVDAMLDLIKADTEIQKLKVKNTADILIALEKGKINVRDAKDLALLLNAVNGEGPELEGENKLVIEVIQGGAK